MTKTLGGSGGENLVASHWSFNSPVPPTVAILLLIVIPAVLAVWYWRRLTEVTAPVRVALTAMRVFAIALLLFLAFDPSIVARLVKPGEQFVILLFDDSRSMRIGGSEGRARGDRLVEAYSAAQEDFENTLKQRHRVVKYRVGGSLAPLEAVDSLQFEDRESRLVGGVQQALRDFEGTNVSAVVLFSDGVNQSGGEGPTIEEIDPGVPVYAVGVDSDSEWRDIELSRLAARRTEFDKSPVEVLLGVAATGLEGREAQIEVRVGSRAVAAKTITLGPPGEEQQVRLSFLPDREGWVEYDARVQLLGVDAEADPASFDRIGENNNRRFIIDSRDTQYRVLYVSGRPNWENKFVHRALEDDEELDLASLILISNAEKKFEFRGTKTTLTNPLFEGFEEEDRPRYDEAVYLRINVPKGELATGFPQEAKELFDYDLIIFGNMERQVLNNRQLELARSFVERRGGSLLLLGGETSFGEMGYAGTVIENMLPVVLSPEANSKAGGAPEMYRVTPTMEGLLQGAWAFDEDEIENQRLWEEMPTLYGLDQFALVRAGATVMATVESDDPETNGRPIFAMQRYGEGRSAVLATGDTWQWQLRLDAEDNRHERFWRQLVRSMVHGVADPVVWRGKEDRYPRDADARFEFAIRDDEYENREGLQTIVEVESPDGATEVLPVEESIEESGIYAADYLPAQVGLHKINITAENIKGEVVARLEEAFLVEDDRREFQNARYNAAFLEDIAARTGGGLYDLDGLSELASSIPVPVRQDDELVVLHLWHLPLFYIVAVTLLVAEWYIRRKRGQA